MPAINNLLLNIPGVEKTNSGSRIGLADGKPVKGQSFGEVLQEKIQEVSDEMVEADHMSQDLISGRSNNIHETMLALSKADISFRLLLRVRNKAVEAYQEIMRTQI